MTLDGLQQHVSYVLVLYQTSAAVLECDTSPFESSMINRLKRQILGLLNPNQLLN